jgi:type II restriction enzyme
MNLLDDGLPHPTYTSASQRARALTEGWAARRVACPACEARLERTSANTPVCDLTCVRCGQDHELKSKAGAFGPRVACGAHTTLLAALGRPRPPAFIFLNYSPALRVTSVFAVPSWAITPDMVCARPPLASTARRAGWVGATLDLARVPQLCRVPLVEHDSLRPSADVRHQWERTAFLAGRPAPESRGWTLDVLRHLETLGGEAFTLEQAYAFAPALQVAHPDNHHIHAKIRQQLQVLRDHGLLTFLGRGRYRLVAR